MLAFHVPSFWTLAASICATRLSPSRAKPPGDSSSVAVDRAIVPSRLLRKSLHARSRATSMSMPKDVAWSFAGTEGFEQSPRERKKIEIHILGGHRIDL